MGYRLGVDVGGTFTDLLLYEEAAGVRRVRAALAVADTLTGFVGNCPPAGTRTIGAGAGSAVCGDDLLIASNLAAETSTPISMSAIPG